MHMSADDRILVKLRPSSALRAVSRANLRPLHDAPAKPQPLGLAATPQWYVAELPDGRETPWDLAHAQVAAQLGIAEGEVLFAEPDIVHDIYRDPMEAAGDVPFALGASCDEIPQDGSSGKALGPNTFAWHLDDRYSELGKARDAVEFTEPRTRVAHIDTGYDRGHAARPEHIARSLERSFVEGDVDPGSAADPDNDVFLMDSSGHGTGTIGILAGGKAPATGTYLGGAPQAEILPLRVADRVVLIRTSALAKAFGYATANRCDVVSLSMGGAPTRVWNEEAYNAYLAGVCIVAAAGNNSNGLPTRNLVYPARYGCVIAACGVMANGEAYSGLTGVKTLEGNYGPDGRMTSAIAAYTPNIPWPRFGCPKAIRLNGEGTSAATPQVAAAAALWLEKYKHQLPRSWKRVEALRNALFASARDKRKDKERFGHGTLRAHAALSVRPMLGLPQTEKDSNWFPILRVLTGLGLTEPTPREEMFNLELMQRLLFNPALAKIVPDPDATEDLAPTDLKKLMEVVIEDDEASVALREHVRQRYPALTGGAAAPGRPIAAGEEKAIEAPTTVTEPPYRRIRVYAVDPSLSTRLETAATNELTLQVRWEALNKGPTGEYLEVDDKDASGKTHAGVDLDDPLLLAQDGWAPSEGNPQFHQQMVYAVAMKTIDHFERALGRPVLWRHEVDLAAPDDDSRYRGRLRIRPHALRQANAFYSPREGALLFGYFEAKANDPGHHLPRGRVYTCLCHDIVAHETSHAILDGMHRRFSDPSNPDVLALHEAFADVVALMQHFTLPKLLEREIARSRGDLEAESLLGSLAVQMGYATGGRGALRDAIGRVEDGAWKRLAPDPTDLDRKQTPHARGAILVAAIFDAFIAIHKARTADLFRIYTGGTGVLQPGAIHPDLVGRIAGEAAKSATHVLNMCIRALDYLPPVDVTFGDYLRALITADVDLVADDRYNYRVAFIDAFRRRGIYPIDLDTLAVDTLRWKGLDYDTLPEKQRRAVIQEYDEIMGDLRVYADDCLYISDREELFEETRKQRRTLHRKLSRAFKKVPTFAELLGLETGRSFEVHELRRAGRVGPDGRHIPQLVVALIQRERMRSKGTPPHIFSGGSTLVVNLVDGAIKYRIGKSITSEERKERTAEFHRAAAGDPLRALLLTPMSKKEECEREPFALLHSVANEIS
jgi:hypothetical protein